MTTQPGISYAGVPRNSSDETLAFLRDGHYNEASKSTTTAQIAPCIGEDQGTHQPVQWRISPYTPMSMVSLFLSGVLVAIGHHLFYLRFDLQRVHTPDDGTSRYLSQTWIIRYGTAFAFASKTLLAGSVVVAYKQVMWINLRHKANSIFTIDAVFAATHDPLAFFSLSFILNLKVPVLLALIAWCLPLAALITPSTLVIRSGGALEVMSASHVPTLNLNDSSLYKPVGFYESASPILHRTTLATVTAMSILPMNRVLAINSSYAHEFEGPSFKCETATGYRLQNISAVFNETKQQIQDGRMDDANIRYLSFTNMELGILSEPGFYNVSAFVSECIIGTTFGNCHAPVGGWGQPILWARLGAESITCAVHNTFFNVQIEAFGSTQTMTRVDFEWKDRIDLSSASDGEGDIARYSFYALTYALNGFFGIGHASVKSMIADTALLELLQRSIPQLRSMVTQEDWMLHENRTFAEIVEELSRNQTLSLFSSEKLWLPMEQTNLTTVTHTTYPNVYEYRPYNLWLAYGIAVASSFIAVLLGLYALWLNGVSHDNSFSSIMASTRNGFLDELTLGHSLGATPMSKVILGTKLRFGELSKGMEKDRPRASFGVEEAIQPLEKGQLIY